MISWIGSDGMANCSFDSDERGYCWHLFSLLKTLTDVQSSAMASIAFETPSFER